MKSASRCPRLQEQGARMLERSILAIVAVTLLTAAAAQAQQATRTKFIVAKNDDCKVIEEVGKLTGLIN
jgi:hypothetical protein